jgi:Tfp pilus assembly protein FimT
MRPKPIKFSCSRSCAPASRASLAGAGFALAEMLTAIVLGALVLGVAAIAFTAYLKRAWADETIAQAESLGSRMSAAITAAMKTSSAWSIYPDKASYLSDPINNVCPQGNALVCQTTTASGKSIVVLFSYEEGRLFRAEASASNKTNSISNVSPISGAVFNDNNGLVSGGFAIQTPLERLTFNAYGSSLHMR